MSKYGSIKSKSIKQWEHRTGDKQNRSAATCTMDNRPKRLRTRSALKRFSMRDYE